MNTFTISQLISQLELIKKKHGDLLVFLADSQEADKITKINNNINDSNDSNAAYMPESYAGINNGKYNNSFAIMEGNLVLLPAYMPQEFNSLKKAKKVEFNKFNFKKLLNIFKRDK
jgi:hypothetical protein